MFIRETLKRVPGYTAIGAAILVSFATFMVQQSFGQATPPAYQLTIPVETIIYEPAGSKTLLKSVNVPSQNQGLICSIVANARNQSSVHPGNDLIIASNGTSVTAFDVERAPNVSTPANGSLTLGNNVTVTLDMGPDALFSAGIDVTLTCEDPLIEVCRDGAVIEITRSTRKSSDTNPPCPQIEVCRDGYVIYIDPATRKSTDTNPPCPQIEVCRDSVVVSIDPATRKSTDTNPPCPEIEVCRDGYVVSINPAHKKSTDTDPPCPQIEVCRDGVVTSIDPAHRKSTDANPPCPVADVACETLTAIDTSRTGRNLTATARANNATITAYTFDFGDGSSERVETSNTMAVASHDYAAAGTYKSKATVQFKDASGKQIVKKCDDKTIVIEEVSSIACTAFNVQELSRTSFQFQVLSFVTGNAAITGYELETEVGAVIGSSTNGSFTLDRDTVGDYTVRAYALGTVNDEAVRMTSDSCVATITVDPPDVEPEIHQCTGLLIDQLARERFSASPSFTEGSNPYRLVYKVNGKVVQDSNSRNLEFEATKEGSYRIDLTAYLRDTDGKTVKVTCSSSVTVVAEDAPRVLGTTTAPPVLPNTGTSSALLAIVLSAMTTLVASHYVAKGLYKRQFES